MGIALRAITYVMAGIGLADIAKDWFLRPATEPKPTIFQRIQVSWLSWLITALSVFLLLRYTNILKKR